MAEPDDPTDPKKKRNPPVDVRITQTAERHKSIRLGIVCTCIAFCVWRITECVVKLKDEPPSVKITLAVLAGLAPWGSQTPIFWWVMVAVRRFTRNTTSRLTALERLHDPGRTSTDLLPDGTDPPGDNCESSD